MAGRPPLHVGTHGVIRARPHTRDEHGEPTSFIAVTYYRDIDGETRRVSKTGRSINGAKNALKLKLRQRSGPIGGTELNAETRFDVAARAYLDAFARRVETGKRAPNTLRRYRIVTNVHLVPVMGGLRLREANSVTRCNEVLVSIAEDVGAPTASVARAVLSGVIGHAIRLGALGPNAANAVRECEDIASKPKRAPRAMTREEREDWLDKLEASKATARLELPDVTRLLLATGVRIGELFGITFDDVDFDARTVAIDWQIIRIDKQGLARVSTKTVYGERTLRLPDWAMAVIRRRKLRYGYGPLFPSWPTIQDPTREHAEAWRDPKVAGDQFRRARAAAGYGWVTTHALRKTVATVLDEAGLPARVVADQLGHSQISMTTDTYMGRKAVHESAAEALEAINPDRRREAP